MLDVLGITAAATSTWRRLDEWPIRRMQSHYYCDCEKPNERVELRAARLRGRSMFIGQCGRCRVIYWRDAVRE